jgi:hypothetical protein
MTYEEKSAIVIEQLRSDRDRLLDAFDKIKAEIQNLRGCSCSCSDGIIDDIEEIIDKYIAENEVKE